MNSSNHTQKNVLSNEEVIKILIKLRNSNGSIFQLLPKDITNYMINISNQLPNTLFDKISHDLKAVCDDYIIIPNANSDIAQKTKDFLYLLNNNKTNECQDFICLIGFIHGLIRYLTDTKNKLFLGKLNTFCINHEITLIFNAKVLDSYIDHFEDTCRLYEKHKKNEHINLNTLALLIIQETKAMNLQLTIQDSLRNNNISAFELLNKLKNRFLSWQENSNLHDILYKEIQHHLKPDTLQFFPSQTRK